MGWFRRKAEIRAEPGEASFDDALLRAMLGGGAVTKSMALQVPTVSGGIDLIANVVASTPVRLYHDGEGRAAEVRDDPRVRLLCDETGDTLTANEFWKALVWDYYLGKGGYAYIRREKGQVKSLHYVDEEQISIQKNSDPIFKAFDILVQGKAYKPYDFLKILRNTKDGASGSPLTQENGKLIEVAYESLLFERNAVLRGGNKKGFLKSEKRIDADAMRTLKDAFAGLYSNKSDNMVVLNSGIDFKECSDTATEMQLNENKASNALEFAKLFHVSPELMEGKGAEADTATLAKLAAIPLMTAIQCALNRDFLLEREKGDYYWAFDTKELLKGGVKERFEAYKTALDANFMQIDEVRYAEDLEPLGMSWVKLGLKDVLYDPKTKCIFVPNTGESGVMEEKPFPGEKPPEERANDHHDSENGQFTSGSGGKQGLTAGGESGKVNSSPKAVGQNGGTLKAEDMPEIRVMPGQYGRAQPGTSVTKIHTFAGRGSQKPLRVEDRLVERYGGQKGQWQHTTGDVVIKQSSGKTDTAEVHWFQEPSVGIVGAFVKRWRKI